MTQSVDNAMHTPGEWIQTSHTVYALDHTGQSNRFSALVQGGWTYRGYGNSPSGSDRTSDAELYANARLIAAAPDLLEALEAITEFTDRSSRYVDADPLVAAARAAIRKARGDKA